MKTERIKNLYGTKQEGKQMYTIVRKHYGLPDYLNTYLSNVEPDCFIFDTEQEANCCLFNIFENGEWMQDVRYGKVRYYVVKISEES